MSFDPGNSTGWVRYDTESCKTYGGTIKEDFKELDMVMWDTKPDIVIYEIFALYPGLAKSLSWNTFYPVEVIGVIKYIAQRIGCKIVEQSPSIKKFAGKVDFKEIRGENITPHTKDAFLHLAYYLRTVKL
jgi:hypothetical protein